MQNIIEDLKLKLSEAELKIPNSISKGSIDASTRMTKNSELVNDYITETIFPIGEDFRLKVLELDGKNEKLLEEGNKILTEFIQKVTRKFI